MQAQHYITKVANAHNVAVVAHNSNTVTITAHYYCVQRFLKAISYLLRANYSTQITAQQTQKSCTKNVDTATFTYNII